MRVLFDQGTPEPLRKALTDHDVRTAREMGWSELANGELLSAAETTFDLLLTTDKNLRYQQDLTRRTIAILVLSTTSWPRIQRHLREVVEAVDSMAPSGYVELRIGE